MTDEMVLWWFGWGVSFL